MAKGKKLNSLSEIIGSCDLAGRSVMLSAPNAFGVYRSMSGYQRRD